MRSIRLIVCLISVWFQSCSKDEPIPVDPFVGVIESIVPVIGSSGDTLSIYGKRFGTSPDDVRAFVNGRSATILTMNDTLVRVLVPVRAGTGLVSLAGESGGASGPMFQFLYRTTVQWYAGSAGVAGYADGTASQSRFNEPYGLTADLLGNLYVSDRGNHRIRRISPGANVVTLAGDGQPDHLDGAASSSRFNSPEGLSYDSDARELYVADRLNHCIRKITQQGSVVTIAGIPGIPGFVDAPGAAARFNQPTSVVFDPSYSDLYVGDSENHSIRKLSLQQVVTTFAGNGNPGNGNGQGSSATFNRPNGLLMDSVYRILISDAANHNLRSLQRTTANADSFSGSGVSGFVDGSFTQAAFNNPLGMCWFEDHILVADRFNHAIRLVSASGAVTTLAGNGTAGVQDGVGGSARFNLPVSVTPGSVEGEFFVTDSGNHGIRRLVIE